MAATIASRLVAAHGWEDPGALGAMPDTTRNASSATITTTSVTEMTRAMRCDRLLMVVTLRPERSGDVTAPPPGPREPGRRTGNGTRSAQLLGSASRLRSGPGSGPGSPAAHRPAPPAPAPHCH